MARITCNFYSRTLLRAVDITVIIPTITCPESLDPNEKPNFIFKKKFPVIYLMHGFYQCRDVCRGEKNSGG